MVFCQAFGCSNRTGKGHGQSFHSFPDPQKRPQVFKEWVAAVNITKFEANTYKYSRNDVLCSDHFIESDFVTDMRAQLLGTKPRIRLKNDAVPSVFRHKQPGKQRKSTKKRLAQHDEAGMYIQSVLMDTAPAEELVEEGPSSAAGCSPHEEFVGESPSLSVAVSSATTVAVPHAIELQDMTTEDFERVPAAKMEMEMETKYQIQSPLVIYLSNLRTSDVWTQQKRHFFQQHIEQEQQDSPNLCSDRDEQFAFHLLDIHARFCFKPSCRIAADHVDADIASTSSCTEITNSKALKSSRNQTSVGTSGSVPFKTDYSSSITALHSDSSSKSDYNSCAASSEFVVKDSHAADDVGLHASSSTTVMTVTSALNMESLVNEKPCPSSSMMRTPSGRHGVHVQLNTSEGGEDDSDGWVSEEEPPDMSHDPATDRIFLEIKTEIDDEAGKDCGIAYQPLVKLESPDVSHDIIDKIARQTGRETETSKDTNVQPVEGESELKPENPPMIGAQTTCNSGVRPYKCKLCSVVFTKPTSLFGHMSAHPGARPYKCDVCSMAFARTIILKRHMQTHSEDRPYKCTVCSKGFKRAGTLGVHMRTHSSDGTLYKCNLCSETFHSEYSLQEHMRVHTGGKPFECEVCLRTFAHDSSLKRHRKTHMQVSTPNHLKTKYLLMDT